jgi:hypothetical protein
LKAAIEFTKGGTLFEEKVDSEIYEMELVVVLSMYVQPHEPL